VLDWDKDGALALDDDIKRIAEITCVYNSLTLISEFKLEAFGNELEIVVAKFGNLLSEHMVSHKLWSYLL